MEMEMVNGKVEKVGVEYGRNERERTRACALRMCVLGQEK
jgi:hypothetical protein